MAALEHTYPIDVMIGDYVGWHAWVADGLLPPYTAWTRLDSRENSWLDIGVRPLLAIRFYYGRVPNMSISYSDVILGWNWYGVDDRSTNLRIVVADTLAECELLLGGGNIHAAGTMSDDDWNTAMAEAMDVSLALGW